MEFQSDQIRQADRDLALRAKHGSWAFPFVVLVLGFATPYARDYAGIFYSIAIASVLLGAARIWILYSKRALYPVNPGLWRRLMLALGPSNRWLLGRISRRYNPPLRIARR